MKRVLTKKTVGINVLLDIAGAIKNDQYVKIETANDGDAVDNLFDAFRLLKEINDDATVLIEIPGSSIEVKVKDIFVYKDLLDRIVVDAE